jgi:hypothetical protein
MQRLVASGGMMQKRGKVVLATTELIWKRALL